MSVLDAQTKRVSSIRRRVRAYMRSSREQPPNKQTIVCNGAEHTKRNGHLYL